jgi:hypothetical protein
MINKIRLFLVGIILGGIVFAQESSNNDAEIFLTRGILIVIK